MPSTTWRESDIFSFSLIGKYGSLLLVGNAKDCKRINLSRVRIHDEKFSQETKHCREVARGNSIGLHTERSWGNRDGSVRRIFNEIQQLSATRLPPLYISS